LKYEQKLPISNVIVLGITIIEYFNNAIQLKLPTVSTYLNSSLNKKGKSNKLIEEKIK
jgi:hypothetical protein